MSFDKALQDNVVMLLNLIGDRANCRDCGITVWWVQHRKTGKKAPYTAEAVNHLTECPMTQDFRNQPLLQSVSSPVVDRKAAAAGD